MASDMQPSSLLEDTNSINPVNNLISTEERNEVENVNSLEESIPKLLPRPEHPLSRRVSPNQEEECEVLSPCSVEYITAKRKIEDTLTTIIITRIEKVHNPYLEGCYLLKKAECESRTCSIKENILFHATRESSIYNSIIKDNLDWRQTRRCKFGQGVSFARTASYANLECSPNRGQGFRTKSRAMIIAKVLVGNCIKGSNCTLPSKIFDTSTDRTGVVCVKYHDNEFYPEYVVYYTSII